MARPSGPKTRNGGRWTEAEFTSFITNNLRMASRKWGPIHDVSKKANEKRGFYRCNECNELVPGTTKVGRKRVSNIAIDHIDPIVDPAVGFTTWDDYIHRMFCEEENLQVLCKDCHDRKSQQEKLIAAERRANARL